MAHGWIARRRSLIVEFGFFTLSVAVFQGSRFLLSFVVAAKLNPAEFAVWVLALTLFGYSPTLLLGTMNGMNRLVPLLVGGGRTMEADAADQTAWTTVYAVLAALVVTSVIAAILWGATGALITAAAGLTILYQAHQFTLRSRLRFNIASTHQTVIGLAMVLITGVIAAEQRWSVEAIIGLYCIAMLLGAIFGFVRQRRFRLRLDPSLLRELLSVGFPIMLVGLAFSLLTTADRWIATAVLGLQASAPYGLASLAASAGLLIPTIVSQQMYPRMARSFGMHADGSRLLRLARMQGIAATLLTLPATLLISAMMILVVPKVLPAYESATLPTVILSLGMLVIGFFTGYGNLLTIVGAQWRLLRIQVAAVVIGLVAMASGALALGMGGLASGLVLAFVVYGVTVRRHAIKLTGS
jgi:O-antigen/teichoic acid export membrane protein